MITRLTKTDVGDYAYIPDEDLVWKDHSRQLW